MKVKRLRKWCFGSCQFLCGLWMDLSGEVANIHRTDAKNLVTAARTIHLPEQKETIHMMLRKEACSGSIQILLTQPKLAWHCLTKASMQMRTTPVGIKDIHPDVRTPMEHKAHTQRSLRWSLARRWKDHSLIRVSGQLIRFSVAFGVCCYE